MKLHSAFHDYYDTAVGYGIDRDVHYNRSTAEVSIKLETNIDLPVSAFAQKSLIIGFCGQIFPLLQTTDYDENYKPIAHHFAYTYEDFYNKMLVNKPTREMLKQALWWQNKKQTEKEIKKMLTKKLSHDKIKQFFTDWNRRDDTLFLEYKVPIWAFQFGSYKQSIILNPKLKDFEFERIKNANTAFQEISMYLSVLTEQKELAVIEDKYRIVQHGFDLKTSFRKEK